MLPNEALPNEFVRLSFLISYIATGERLLIGSLALVNKVNHKILDFCDKILTNLPEKCFYARIDLLLENDFPFLMEVELIEPSLYFNLKPGSNDFFAKELVKYLEGTSNQ